MQQKVVQIVGLVVGVVYAVLIIWLYATEPRSFSEVATGAQVATGSYRVDARKGLILRSRFFAGANFVPRATNGNAPIRLSLIQRHSFYIAYSFYREGWGRVYHDQNLFKQGLEAVNRAIALSPAPLAIEDDNLQMRTAAELKTELEQGTERTWSDLNPLEVMRKRK